MPHLLVALSAHGFGHTAQSAPVINALRRKIPDIRLSLRTDLPASFLASRFGGEFDVVPGADDFGMAMRSALAVDREQTARRYAVFHDQWDKHVAAQSAALVRLKPDLVVSNISYLTLAGARAARIPAVALCSFTWAQIYAHFFSARPEARRVLEQMRAAYLGAEQVLALEPGMPLDDLPQPRPMGVVARLGRHQAALLRARLGISERTRLVTFSLGGIDHPLDLMRWPHLADVHWLVPKAILPSRPDMTAHEDLPFHFTDLLASSDALIAKPGYGNFTEAACNGVRVLYVPRGDWPEEPYLVDWMHRHACARSVSAETLISGDLRSPLEALWSMPPPVKVFPEGTSAASRLLAAYL